MKIKTEMRKEEVLNVLAQLAHGDAKDQAEAFDVFFKELESVCETAYRLGFQLASISDHLDEKSLDGIEFLKREESC